MGQVSSEPPRFYSGSCGLQGRRPSMEDAYCIHDSFGDNTVHPYQSFFGIFDGHNGARCAEYLAYHIPMNLLKEPHFKEHPEVALTGSFKRTNQHWFRDEAPKQDGSCAVTALIRGDVLYVANTGDSRAIISQGEQVIPLSRDHKPTDCEEAERIMKLGGKIIGGRVEAVLAVSRAFGDLDYRSQITCEPDVKLWTIEDDTEFLVLACDGVWDVASNEDVGRLVREQLLAGSHPDTVAYNLVQYCFARRSLDNITVIIVSFLTKERRKVMEQIKLKKLEQVAQEPAPISFTIPAGYTEKRSVPLRAKDPVADTGPPFRRNRARGNSNSNLNRVKAPTS